MSHYDAFGDRQFSDRELKIRLFGLVRCLRHPATPHLQTGYWARRHPTSSSMWPVVLTRASNGLKLCIQGRDWRIRPDPFAGAWEEEVAAPLEYDRNGVPLLPRGQRSPRQLQVIDHRRDPEGVLGSGGRQPTAHKSRPGNALVLRTRDYVELRCPRLPIGDRIANSRMRRSISYPVA